MYHCHIQFYLSGCQYGIFEAVKKLPPLEHFTHDFFGSETPEPALAARADVILAELNGPEPVQTLKALTAWMKEDAQLILLINRELANALADHLSCAHDIWFLPLSEQELCFRFQNWQRNHKQSKDLWQTSQFLDTAINGTPQLIWFKNREGIHKKVNDSFCKVIGKPKQDVEGHTHAYIWDVEQDDPACVESEQEAMRIRKLLVSDESVHTSSGEMLLTTYKSPLYDLDGSVMGTVGIGVNVTRERAYEQKLIEKEHTLEILFSTMDCGMMCHSLDGKRVININQAALWLLGYDSQEELEREGFRLVAQSVLDEDKPRLRECITSLKKAGDSITTEYRVLHKDGKILHILGNAKLMEEGGELYYQRFLLDITAQKLEEAKKWAQKDREIQYQEQKFDVFSTFLSDNIDDVYMMMDEDGKRVEFITPNVERVLGVSCEAILNNAQAIGRAEYLSGREVDDTYLMALKPGMALEAMETKRIHRQTGEERWFRESVYCVLVQGKKKIIVYISDRTRERRIQDTLSEALEMANVANKAKSKFLSSVSHDIRTPMNAIMGFTTLLQEEADNPARVIECTQNISAASQHLLGLINDVLDMNKIESGNVALNISEFNLADIIDELNTIIRPQARDKNQTFEIRTSSLNFEHLLGDQVRINQVMINILSNAVKYTHNGGKIEMQVRELPQVDQNYSRIQFVIRDNGQGMSDDYQKVLFDPFTREQDVAWSQTQGTGLGMAITKNLVDLMGGTITVDSQMGKGSTFTVELELRIQETEEDPRFWERHGISHMIVADDDENICRDIVKKMSGTSVATQYATNGVQAMEMIRDAGKQGEPYDLILLDWKMPELNGLETARLIRRQYSEKIPILLFTAYDLEDIEQKALEADIVHFLPKPFFVSNFKDTIRQMQKRVSSDSSKKSAVAGKHILIVDDIEVNRLIMTKILDALGADCETAADGQEAVDKFLASRPGEYDLILMDIQMPRMDGYEATRVIRASSHPSAQKVAIIATTANAFVDDIRNALDSGMDAHVSKPVMLEQLMSTIQDVLDRKNISKS